jgi:hypothetical protein
MLFQNRLLTRAAPIQSHDRKVREWFPPQTHNITRSKT